MTQIQISQWEKIKTEETERKRAAQERLCQESKALNFTAQTPNCPNEKCGVDILFYVSEREAEVKHITSCPICNFSLCE